MGMQMNVGDRRSGRTTEQLRAVLAGLGSGRAVFVTPNGPTVGYTVDLLRRHFGESVDRVVRRPGSSVCEVHTRGGGVLEIMPMQAMRPDRLRGRPDAVLVRDHACVYLER